MPNIYINEIDETTGGRSIDSTDVAYVPGFAEVNSNVYIFRKSGQEPYGLEGTWYQNGANYNTVVVNEKTKVRELPMFACNVIDRKTWKYDIDDDSSLGWQLQNTYTEPSAENEPVLCTSTSQFETLFGKLPYRFVREQYGVDDWDRCVDFPEFSADATPNSAEFYSDGDYERSYIYAKELLNLGLTVLYENIADRGESGLKALPNVSYLYSRLADCYENLTDKNEYQVKYLTSGAYPTYEYLGPIGKGEQYATAAALLGSASKYVVETSPHDLNTATEVDLSSQDIDTQLIGYDSEDVVKVVRKADWFSDGKSVEQDPCQSYIYNVNDNGYLHIVYGLGANKVWGEDVSRARIVTMLLDKSTAPTTVTTGTTPNVVKALFTWGENEEAHELEIYDGYYIDNGVAYNGGYNNESTFSASIEETTLNIDVVSADGVSLYVYDTQNTVWTYGGEVEVENMQSPSRTTYFPAYDSSSNHQFTPQSVTISYGDVGDRRSVEIIPGTSGEMIWVDPMGNSIEVEDGGYSVTVLLNNGWGIYESSEDIACIARATINIDDYGVGGIVGKMVSCAGQLGENGRGDCVAIIDHTNNPDRPLVGANSVYGALTAENGAYVISEDAEFAAMFTPWAVYDVVAEDNKVPTRQIMPGSFAYLLSLAKSIKNNPNWLAVAGAARGAVPYIKSLNTVERLSNKIANDLQPRNGKTSINPITNIKPYGLLIWGNRTMKDNSVEGNLTATSFLNIRNLVSDVKKQAYVTAKKYMFEQSTDILWVNFKAGITPLLDRMQSGQGLSGYKIIKGTTDEKAKVVATIKLYPYYAVEDFEITVVISDEEVTVE